MKLKNSMCNKNKRTRTSKAQGKSWVRVHTQSMNCRKIGDWGFVSFPSWSCPGLTFIKNITLLQYFSWPFLLPTTSSLELMTKAEPFLFNQYKKASECPIIVIYYYLHLQETYSSRCLVDGAAPCAVMITNNTIWKWARGETYQRTKNTCSIPAVAAVNQCRDIVNYHSLGHPKSTKLIWSEKDEVFPTRKENWKNLFKIWRQYWNHTSWEQSFIVPSTKT